jgi:hypothetical protein
VRAYRVSGIFTQAIVWDLLSHGYNLPNRAVYRLARARRRPGRRSSLKAQPATVLQEHQPQVSLRRVAEIA